MLVYKCNKKLSNLEEMCVFCSKYVDLNKEYVATYNRKQWKLAHKNCYDNYFLNIKKGKNNE